MAVSVYILTSSAGTRPSFVAQMLKHLPAMWETLVRSLDWEDPLEKEIMTHFSVLAWENAMDRGVWKSMVQGSQKSQTQFST